MFVKGQYIKQYSSQLEIGCKEALYEIRTMARPWSDLRNLLPIINRYGYDYALIEEFTAVPTSTLSLWGIGGKVLDSIKNTGQVSDKLMNYFEIDDRYTQLAELRYISILDRIEAIATIYEMKFDKLHCSQIARFHKQHEREKKGASLFSSQPGDLLAFRYWQEISENNDERKRRTMISKGIEFAVTKSARESLRNLENISEEIQKSTDYLKADVRDRGKEKLDFRAVPVLGCFPDIAPEQLDVDVLLRVEPPFGLLKIPDHLKTFVVLPLCESLSNAREPFAILVDDYKKISSLSQLIGESDVYSYSKLSSNMALLVLERSISGHNKCKFYLKLSQNTGQLTIVPRPTALHNIGLLRGCVLNCL
eukprot:gnl/MRDRNA2_/MRDRNA2_86671_c1_seq2.p2 gnl/MRDRNA2_/MRDRNA2_86671_c1~~gnl/MRDRNA2_/MRDRNA2_86671_c1_seq2.p2  ORF type:complete len:365 (+),score=-0.41 gnl/MRDRNA2_/MRDRNA2_86671_c1_seq2:1858-2952(+)